MKIWYFTPYALDGNLGKAYNEYCELVKNENDWICFIDGDVAFLNSYWGKHFEDLIKKYPNAGIITAYTNRVGCLEQCLNGMISDESDIKIHKQIAYKCSAEHYLEVKEINHVISGHIMLFKKKTWIDAKGFPETLRDKDLNKYSKNMATVDNRFSRRVLNLGKKILLAKGMYVFHYYRLKEGIHSKEHLGLLT